MKDNLEPNAAIEIHDSKLERIETSGDDVIAVIDAYVHRSTGRPGVDRGTGWTQPVQLRIFRGKAAGSVAMIPMELYAGRIVLSGETFTNIIPMPLNHTGPSRIEFESSFNLAIVIEGDGVTCEFTGPPVYLETFEP